MRKLRRRIEQHEYEQQKKLRKRVRRRALAEHFSVNIRTIDAWAKRGVIPPPHYLKGSSVPFWFTDQTIDCLPSDQSEKAA